MKQSSRRALGAPLPVLAAAALAACGGAASRPPAGGAPVPATVAAGAPRADSGAAASAAPRGYTAADVRFVQRMLPHHQQALTMTALVPDRAARPELRLLAERIALSQETEMAQMRGWLERRGEPVAAADPHAGHHGAAAHAMPGMLTPDELARLAAATGPAFDRLFLEYMIRHHEGALTMVAELFASPGGGRESEIYRLASEVDADQRAEIRRMRALLDAPPAGAPPR